MQKINSCYICICDKWLIKMVIKKYYPCIASAENRFCNITLASVEFNYTAHHMLILKMDKNIKF